MEKRDSSNISNYSSSNHLIEVNQVWYQEYQDLEDLTAKIDWMLWELTRLRQGAEQKMSDLDQLYNPNDS